MSPGRTARCSLPVPIDISSPDKPGANGTDRSRAQRGCPAPCAGKASACPLLLASPGCGAAHPPSRRSKGCGARRTSHAEGKWGSTTPALCASEPKVGCRAVPVSHWLGEPVPLSSTPGRGQFNRFARISVPLSQPAHLASLALAHRLLTWLALVWPHNYCLGFLEKTDSGKKPTRTQRNIKEHRADITSMKPLPTWQAAKRVAGRANKWGRKCPWSSAREALQAPEPALAKPSKKSG